MTPKTKTFIFLNIKHSVKATWTLLDRYSSLDLAVGLDLHVAVGLNLAVGLDLAYPVYFSHAMECLRLQSFRTSRLYNIRVLDLS